MSRLKRGIWISLALVLSLPLFVALAFIVAVNLIDFNQYKPMIEQEISAKTGREFNIDGEIKASIWPFKLTLGASQLAQPQGFDQAVPFLRFTQLELQPSVWALLSQRQIQLLEVALYSPQLTLITHSDGTTNWSGLAQAPSSQASSLNMATTEAVWLKVHQTTETLGATAASSWLNLALAQLHVYGANLTWHQHDTQQTYRVTELDVSAQTIQFGAPFYSEWRGRFHPNDSQMYEFNQTGELEVAADFSHLHIQQLSGELHAAWQNEHHSHAVRFNTEISQLIWQPPLQQLQLSAITLNTEQQGVRLQLQGQYGQAFLLSGHIEFNQVDPRHWLDLFDIPYPHFIENEALRLLDGGFDWHLSPEHWRIDAIQLSVDQTKLLGHVSYQHQQNAQYQFDLKLSQLNLDHYVAQSESSATANDQAPISHAPTTAQPNYLPLALPITTLRESDIQGQLLIEDLQLWHTDYQKIQLGINAAYGRIDVAPFDIELYGGSLLSQLTLDVNGDTPSYKFKGRMQNINNQAWLNDSLNYDLLSGELSGRFDLTSSGSNIAALKYHLNGQFSAQLINGGYRSLDINKLLAGQKSEPNDVTQLSSLQLNGQILNGMLHLQQTRLTSERFEAQAFGRVDIPNALWHTDLMLVYSQPPQALSHLSGLSVPIKMRGALVLPEWQVDLKQFLNSPSNQQKVIKQIQNLWTR